MLEESVRAPQRDKDEAVIRRREAVAVLEILPEILDGLLALVVCCADREASLDLAGEFLGTCASAFADNQEVVGLPPKVLCLKADLRHHVVDQDWGNAAHEQLGEPVRRDVLLEEGTRSARGGRRGSTLPGQMMTPSTILRQRYQTRRRRK